MTNTCIYCGINCGGYHSNRCKACSKQLGSIMKAARKKTADNVAILHDIVEKFRVQSKLSEPKCYSDHILLYIRYALSKVDEMITVEMNNANYRSWRRRQHSDELTDMNRKKDMEKKAIELYEKIRGEVAYTSQNPRSVAAAIIYISAMLSRVLLTQTIIGKYLVISTIAINAQYRRLKKGLSMDEIV